MNRENIVAKVYDLLKGQRSVKLGKVERDPLIPSELSKTAFPAAYIETTDEDIETVTSDGLRNASMLCNVVLSVSGANRDKQRNIAVTAIENTLMADRTLAGNCRDIQLIRVETIEIGEASPFASFRLVFEIQYCYKIEE